MVDAQRIKGCDLDRRNPDAPWPWLAAGAGLESRLLLLDLPE